MTFIEVIRTAIFMVDCNIYACRKKDPEVEGNEDYWKGYLQALLNIHDNFHKYKGKYE